MVSPLLSLVAVHLALNLSAVPQQSAAESERIVTVGREEISVPTDYVTLTIGVLTQSRSPIVAADSALRMMDAVADSLAAYNLLGDSLRSRSFQVEPRRSWNGRSEQLTGYVASGAYTFPVHDLSSVRRVIQACLDGGATEVRHVQAQTNDQARLRETLLIRAVTRSRRLADSLATAAGGSIGRLLELETDDAEGWRWSGFEGGAVFLEQSQTVRLAPPTMTVRASVKVAWSFVPTS